MEIIIWRFAVRDRAHNPGVENDRNTRIKSVRTSPWKIGHSSVPNKLTEKIRSAEHAKCTARTYKPKACWLPGVVQGAQTLCALNVPTEVKKGHLCTPPGT